MAVVVDACALAKVFLDEEHSEALRTFVRTSIDEGRTLLAPRLVAYELGNIVAAQFPERDPEGQGEILDDALTLVRSTPLEEPSRVLQVAGETDSFYDAAYLWVARRESADLLTYDEPLRKAAEAHGLSTRRPTDDGAES